MAETMTMEINNTDAERENAFMNTPLGDSESGRKGYHQLRKPNNFRGSGRPASAASGPRTGGRLHRTAFGIKTLGHRVAPVLLLLVAAVAGAEEDAAVPIADLAARADVVALARVRSTDYVYRREYPYRGAALLEVLISYKGEAAGDPLEVYEEGLHPFECYFPQPALLTEGRRYLVFLARDPDKPERFRGLPQGCALDVLVTADNRYALRMPVDGANLANDFEPYAGDMRFSDQYAIETEESIKPERRDALLLEGNLERVGERYRFTRGIPLEKFRPLLEIELR